MNGIGMGASGSSTTSSNCAVPSGAGDHVKAGDRVLAAGSRRA
jgi:hypothetical protein